VCRRLVWSVLSLMPRRWSIERRALVLVGWPVPLFIWPVLLFNWFVKSRGVDLDELDFYDD
jgi:hypothetical protein